MSNVRTAGRVAALIACSVLMGSTNCGSGSATAPVVAPPPPFVPGTFFIQDLFQYFPNTTCSQVGLHYFSQQTASLAQQLQATGWTSKGIHDSSTAKPEDWFESGFPICARDPDVCGLTNDGMGVDTANLVVISGHGLRPDLPRPLAWGAPQAPYQALLWSSPTMYPLLSQTPTIPVCGVRLSAGTTKQLEIGGTIYNLVDPNHFDTMLGAGSGGQASHAVFITSCTIQPRLLPNYLVFNRTSQVFGFMYSPVDGTMQTAALGQFYLDSEVVGNAIAYLDNVRLVASITSGIPAGATVATFADPKDPTDTNNPNDPTAEQYSSDARDPRTTGIAGRGLMLIRRHDGPHGGVARA